MRGGNTRTGIEAYDFDGQELTRRWQISRDPNNGSYGHNVRIGDIDGDGRDELVYFSAAFDDDGTLMWTLGRHTGSRAHDGSDPGPAGMEISTFRSFLRTTRTRSASVRPRRAS